MHPVLSDPPRLQGRFRIDTELARGGMGTVFSALDESTGQRVALKRLTHGAPPRTAALFEREFYVLSSLKHPRIIEVYDYGIDSDGPYYTMELLEGSDLRELSPLPALQACRYLRDVASSLALLHARRLLHRDVSPRNVRALADGRCKLIDFGALASFGTNEELVGTPPTIPPEALSGQALDQRADLYSLGTLAYFLLTGRHAYPARNVSALPETWLQPPLAPSRYASDVSPALDGLVLSLLSLDMLARPSSASEVIEHLQVIAGLESEHDEHTAQAYFVGAALVERESELERVQRRLHRANTGQGGAFFVTAEPGLGKTRFIAEVSVLAQLAGSTALRVDAAAHSIPLSTARALVKQLFRLLPKSANKVFRPHAATLRAVWPELVELQQGGTQEQSEPNGSSSALAALPALLEACVRNLARKHALVIAIDNVEHVDPQSAALLMTLSRAAHSERLVVITTACIEPGTDPSVPLRALRDAGTEIQLRALTEAGVVTLVQTAFGDVPHVRRTATRLYAATSGNPEHCMRLLQRCVDGRLIQYVGGTWSLPLELSADALVGADHVLQDRLRHCSEEARQVAASLAVLDRPAQLEWCILLESASQSRRAVMAALDELVQAEVLSQTSAGYRFLHPPLRSALLDSMDATRLRTLQLRVAEALLTAVDGAIETQLQAGLLLIHGAQEVRGAELIAKLARVALAEPTDTGPLFARASNAFEAALDVYRRSGHSSLSQLDLLVALVLASHYISPAFAQRYADAAIASLEQALGLIDAHGTRAPLDASSLRTLLAAAPMLAQGETVTASTPDAATLVGWLIRCVMSVTATAAAAIDHEALARFARVLQPFLVFGRNHPAAAAHEYCRLVLSMSESRPAASHAGWSELLGRLGELEFSPPVQRRLRLGALFSLGVLECQRDDDVALARMQDIEQEGSPLSVAYADQLRFLYYGFRGDLNWAQRYRDRVEAHAVQYGSAWQVEIWSTCTLSSVYANTRDAAGNKRAVEQLQRLKQTFPSLEPYWERAAAGQLRLTGAPERAIELYEHTLARPDAHERVAWSSVRGSLARAHNDLRQHAVAKRLCEQTLARCQQDLAFVAVTLTLRVELCRALAGLADFGSANTQLDALFELYAANKNPVTLGTLHRTGAEIAILQGDAATFEQHVAAMQTWYQPTRNPALIAQCDQLQNAAAQHNVRKDMRAAAAHVTMLTDAQSILSSCDGPPARKQRALELVAAYAGITEAWLFGRGRDNEPVVVGRLGISDVPADLVPKLRLLFEEIPDDADETAFVLNTFELNTTSPHSGSSHAHRLLPLTIDQGAERLLVGVIVFRADIPHRGVHHGFLQGVATQLFEAGDLVTVRSVETAVRLGTTAK